MALRYVTEAKQFGAALCGCHALCRGLFGSHLAAHAVPQFLGFAVLAACGLRAWFVDGGYLELASTPGVTHASAFGELASTLQIPFQLYELACALGVKRLRGKSFELVAHHALALLLAVLSARKGLYFYYGAYFMGVSLCGNQIFNPTPICAYSKGSTQALRLGFENSTRAIDSSKNQPNRLRFGRAREV